MHLITSSRIDGKCVWVFVSDVSVAVLLIAHRNLMACRNIHFGVSAEEANIEDPLEFPGSEHAKRLLTLCCLTGCDTVGKFYVSIEP